MLDNNTLNLISYVVSAGVIYGIKRVENKLEQQRQDKNSFYSKQAEYLDKQNQWLEQQMGEANYQKGKQLVVDAVYKAEQLGKTALWDGLTKNSKVLEWVAGKTGLSDEDIFDIIESTVGKINAGLKDPNSIQAPTSSIASALPAIEDVAKNLINNINQ